MVYGVSGSEHAGVEAQDWINQSLNPRYVLEKTFQNLQNMFFIFCGLSWGSAGFSEAQSCREWLLIRLVFFALPHWSCNWHKQLQKAKTKFNALQILQACLKIYSAVPQSWVQQFFGLT